MSASPVKEDRIIRGPKLPIEPEESVGRCLLRRAISYGDRLGQIYAELGPLRVSFRELSRGAANVCVELTERGLGCDDVMVLATNLAPQSIPLVLGAAARGVIVAPINPDDDANDLRNIIVNTLQPRMVVAEEKAAIKIRTVCPEIDVFELSDVDSWLERGNVPLDSEGNVDLDRVAPPNRPGWLDDTAIILCSSGTTGLPKGVMLTNRNMHSQLAANIETELGVDSGRMLVCTPLFWITAFYNQLLSIYLGCELVLLSSCEEAVIIKTIEKYQVNFTLVAPNCAVSLSKMSELLASHDLSSLRYLVVGGSRMEADTQRMVSAALGVHVIQVYGMTEVLVATGATKDSDPPGSVGRLRPNFEAKVVDLKTGTALGPNCEGELWVRSPTVTKGYYRRPEETAHAIDEDGWFHTGDIAYYDSDEVFFITDRLKDLIKYRGHHIWPSELEGVLLTHPAVKDAAVVGVPHDLDQEHLRAYVVPRPGASVTEAELVAAFDGAVADSKRLRGGVRFVAHLPKTASGKLDRRELKKMVKEEIAAAK